MKEPGNSSARAKAQPRSLGVHQARHGPRFENIELIRRRFMLAPLPVTSPM
jgi:hypothetical protein